MERVGKFGKLEVVADEEISLRLCWQSGGRGLPLESAARESGPSLHIAHLRLDAVPLYYSISLNCGGFGVKYTERKVKP